MQTCNVYLNNINNFAYNCYIYSNHEYSVTSILNFFTSILNVFMQMFIFNPASSNLNFKWQNHA